MAFRFHHIGVREKARQAVALRHALCAMLFQERHPFGLGKHRFAGLACHHNAIQINARSNGLVKLIAAIPMHGLPPGRHFVINEPANELPGFIKDVHRHFARFRQREADCRARISREARDLRKRVRIILLQLPAGQGKLAALQDYGKSSLNDKSVGLVRRNTRAIEGFHAQVRLAVFQRNNVIFFTS